MDDTQKEKLEAFRAQATKDAAAAKEQADLRELAVHELRAALTAGGKLKEGRDFEIVDNPQADAVFAVRAADNQGILNWQNAEKREQLGDAEWMTAFLRNYVNASSAGARDRAAGIEWAVAASARVGLLWQTARAFARLLGNVEDAKQKK